MAGTPPSFSSALTDTTGQIIDVILQDSDSVSITPTTGITGFYVLVNGVPRTIRSAVRKGSSGTDAKTVRLTLYAAVVYGDTVVVSYTTGNVVDGSSNNLTDFYHQTVTNNAVFGTPTLFDPIYWLRGTDDVPVGDVYEHRLGWPMASVLLDTVAPTGDVIINENPASGGINVHHFIAFNSTVTNLAGTRVIQDALDNTMREAGELGGADNETEYEIIGNGNSRCFTLFLAKDGSNNYPSVETIEVGMTATKSKSYILEVRTSDSSNWVPLVQMIADTRTTAYYRYKFKVPVVLAAIRARYRGDYYAASETANITISGQDLYSDVVAAQISHYADFRDAVEFINSDNEGWLDFTEGVSLFNWDLTNTKRMWSAIPGLANGALKRVVTFGALLIACTDTKVYTYLPGDGEEVTLRHTVTGITIKSLAVHKNCVYIGLSDGSVLSSTSGKVFSTAISNSSGMGAVTALISYRSQLWIGTDAGTGGKAKIYTWNGTTLKLEKTFEQQAKVCSLAVMNSYLFAGLASDTGLNLGCVYSFSGSSWALTLAADVDAVEYVAPNTSTAELWAGWAEGPVYALAFDTNNKPTTWHKAYDGFANHYLHLGDDPAGHFFWLTADTGVVGYVQSLDSFDVVAAPPTYTWGLSALWKNSNLTNYKNLSLGTTANTAAVTVPAVSSSLPGGVNSTYFNVKFTGWIATTTTDTYTFYISSDNSARIYVGGELVVDNFTSPTTTAEVSGTFKMVAGSFVPVVIDYCHSTGNPNLIISWSSSTISKRIIPTYSFSSNFSNTPTLTTVNAINYLNSVPYAVCGNGRLYSLDTTDLGTTTRKVYLRLRDAAGNETLVGGALIDNIVQDTQTIDDGSGGTIKVSDGRIYQVNNNDQTVIATFASPKAAALYAPDRLVRQNGVYESEPFYVATLTKWETISFVAQIMAGATPDAGLERGVTVSLYVRTADNYEELLAKEWGDAYERTTIGAPSNAGTVDTATVGDFNIAALQGKWLQYRLVLTTASRNTAPIVQAVVLSYKEAQATYFFSTMFDSATEVAGPVPPLFRRGLLTANMMPNGGMVQFGYTTDDSTGNTFDYSRYTIITPNRVFELPNPASKIRFGILLVSVSSVNPVTVDEYAVQLEAGDADMYLMDVNPPTGLSVVSPDSGHANLTWSDNSPNNTGFQIERSTDNVSYTQISTASANATTYSDTTVSGGTLYYYRVRAYDTSGNSLYSNVVNITTAGSGSSGGTGVVTDTFTGSSADIVDHTTDSGDTWIAIDVYGLSTGELTIDGSGKLAASTGTSYNTAIIATPAIDNVMSVEADFHINNALDTRTFGVVARSNNINDTGTYDEITAYYFAGTWHISSYQWGDLITASVTLTDATDYHLRLEVDDTNATLFVNSTQVLTVNYTTHFTGADGGYVGVLMGNISDATNIKGDNFSATYNV